MSDRGGRGRGRGGGRGGPRGGGGGGDRGGRGGAAPGARGGSPAGRGGGPAIRPPGGPGGGPNIVPDNPHVETVGVKRRQYGISGRAIQVHTNHFPVDIPQGIIYHYDVVITPSEQTLPARVNMEIIRRLQEVVAPQVFTPRAVYDGRKNMFASRLLPFTGDTQTFDVNLHGDSPGGSPGHRQQQREGRGPKPYKVKLTKVAEINPEVLARYLEGKQSHDNTVLTAITALNVVVRHEPTMRYPFNVRSFFTDHETKDIGSGIILWRGYFQSVRPAIGKMLINIDISTGTMFKPGPLIDLCLDFFSKRGQNPNLLAPSHGLPERERQRLQRFISNLRITTTPHGSQQAGRNTPRTIKKLSTAGANALHFQLRDAGMTTVARYFQTTYNRPLRFPDVLCVEVGNGALIPLELCHVPPGQIMRKQVPPERTKDVLEFATKKPHERLQSITAGLGVLSYGQSEYVRSFGLNVHQERPLSISARVLEPPTLKYGAGSRQANIVPRDGAWNMIDKKFYKPATIQRWGVLIYERQNKFRGDTAQEMVQGLVSACDAVGIVVRDRAPVIRWENAQGRPVEHLRALGQEVAKKSGGFPDLLVIILPEGATELYTAIKHFGDVTAGVATQCMKANKCFRAKPQYYANVCLKINVKLGGINTIPDPRSVSFLTDPTNPTIVMGADVIHPAAHAEGRPSFTALVANVDSDTAKYIADCQVQTSRQEMIDDLEQMAQSLIDKYMKYRQNVEKRPNAAPKRIIFYRDGVSEGQFRQVLEIELPRLKQACKNLNISPPPKITVIVVGKRHHVRFFPTQPNAADRSGNCQAGTVVDRDITHPLELDFYLQSHAGLLGTSRPAHYNVLYDENNMQADGIQALSFALCHVYARSTRSVSIPAPVYYADIVCSRAKNHYDPNAGLRLDEEPTGTGEQGSGAQRALDVFKSNFKPLHEKMKFLMYFS